MPRRLPYPSLAILAAGAVVLLTGSASASAGWGADRAQTHAGTVAGVRAAGGSGDRVALRGSDASPARGGRSSGWAARVTA